MSSFIIQSRKNLRDFDCDDEIDLKGGEDFFEFSH
jgi:hypothetical protein